MNHIKKIFAAVLLLAMLASVIGCHKKDEIAVKIKDVKFTSAYYMCALINADSQGKSKVQETLTDDEKKAEVDYFSKKIEKKKFVDWVEDTAMESLKEIAAYKILCNKAKLKLDDDVAKNAESYASYYWSNYGYSSYFEPNGVSQKTYTEYMKDSYYSNLYFEHIYGKDGEKAIDAETVKTKIYENFIIADKLEVSLSDKKDEEKTAITEQMNAYVTALQKGTKTFEEIYKETNSNAQQEQEDTDTSKAKPKDKYASVLGAKDSAYASDIYDTVKALKTDEVKLITKEDGSGLTLVVKKEIKDDPYYIDNLDLSSRHLIKDEEYKEYIKNYCKDLKPDISKYAVNQFKVKKIVEPKQQNS